MRISILQRDTVVGKEIQPGKQREPGKTLVSPVHKNPSGNNEFDPNKYSGHKP
jgi:hypothetical protein